MLIWSLLSIIGFGIVLRTLQSYEFFHLFRENLIQKIRIVGFLSILTINFLFRNHIVALWIVQFVIFLSPWWLAAVVQAYREKIIHDQMIPILDSLIISMRSGASLRVAIERSSLASKPTIQLLLKEFMTSLQYKNNRDQIAKNSQIRAYFDEIAGIDEVPLKQVDRLKAMKRRLMTERNFRRKSSQATVQIKAQAWIMAAMYGCLLIYVCHEFGFWQNSKLIFLSGSIFMVGFVVVLNMGRGYRWKL